MAVAQHNIESWFGPQYDSVVPEGLRDQFREVRKALRASAIEIQRYTTPCADQTTAIKRLRESMMFTIFCLNEQK